MLLFEFERELSGEATRVVSQANQSLEQQQRDVYESHRHRTFSLAFYMTGNEIEAEEILAGTFIRAFRLQNQPDAFAVDSALVGELHERFPLNQDEPSPAPVKGLDLGHRNVHRPELEVAIRTLPPTERLLYLMRDVEGYSAALIGRLLDMPEPRVQKTCFSARLRLRQILAEQARTEAA